MATKKKAPAKKKAAPAKKKAAPAKKDNKPFVKEFTLKDLEVFGGGGTTCPIKPHRTVQKLGIALVAGQKVVITLS